MTVTRQRFKNLTERFVDKKFAGFTNTFVIQSLTETPDGQGGYTVGWATFATIIGFVESDNGSESVEDDRLKSSYRKHFSFEYIAGITNDMRISYNGKIYNIRSDVSELEVDVWVTLIADEEVAT